VTLVASGTVVVLPTSDDRHLASLAHLTDSGLGVRLIDHSDGPDATRAARICANLNASPPDPPLIVVAVGGSARLLPAIALGQRAAHRLVRDYLLIEPELPPVSDGWPDAHVSVFSDADQRQARLRGWTVEPLAALVDWVPTGE